MFPLPFYPRPPLGVTRPPGFQEGVFKGRAGNKEEEATCTYDLPQLLPRPMVRGGEFLNPPPTRPFKINRSPGFTFPPPSKHLVAKWSNAGRISPTVELPSPAGQFFPTSSPRTYSATSPSLLYHKPASPSFYHKPSSPNLSFFSKPANSRQRTLIEIPRHDPGPQADRISQIVKEQEETEASRARQYRAAPSELFSQMSSREKLGIQLPPLHVRSLPRPIIVRKLSVSESTLDPNSRPFTPSGNYPASSTCPSESVSGCGSIPDINVHQADYPLGSHEDYYQAFNFDRVGFNFDHVGLVEENNGLDDEHGGHNDDLDFDLEYDPLPEDPSTLLPDLETTQEDLNNNSNSVPNNNNSFKKTIAKNQQARNLDPLLPPLVPDSAWKTGTLRPPLLPTPFNFPPFGPSGLQQLSQQIVVPSDVGRDIRGETESRLLVSGVEQSLNGWIENQTKAIELNQTAERNKRRILLARGSLKDQNKATEFSCLPPPSFSTGGILSQDMSVPKEYLMSHVIGDRIRPINIRQEHTDLLFFLFYSMNWDALQLVAASLLFERGWRFHKQDGIWLARWPGVKPEEKTALYEKGLYQYFDVVTWKRIPGWFRLDYCYLADKTLVPEDLKTLYTRYTDVLKDVIALCGRNLALNGFSSEVAEEFDLIEGIKYMNCII